MNSNEFAKQILTATTLHFQHTTLLNLANDEGEKKKAISNMQQAEEMLTNTLEEFRSLILMEANNK